METSTGPSDPEADVIDLVTIGEACRRLIDWYDRQRAGDSPPITDLDPVMAQLQDLPDVPGELGQDINLVASGGVAHSPDEVIGAIERLRLVANHNQRPTGPGQDRLPGFDEPQPGA